MDINDLISSAIENAINDAIDSLVYDAEIRVTTGDANSCDRWDDSVVVDSNSRYFFIDRNYGDSHAIFISSKLFGVTE
jgi:hypothetical protein